MLPEWLKEKLASPPSAGSGVHGWLYAVARHLHAHMPPEAVAARLVAATANCGRRIPEREIAEAVRNSYATRWTRGEKIERSPIGKVKVEAVRAVERWPDTDAHARECRRRESSDAVAGLYDLWEKSPVNWEEAEVDDWLDFLFPDAEWLCVAGDHPATARTRRKGDWLFGAAKARALIVASPMTGPSGKRQDGQLSHRCLENTGVRRWVVIEWDKDEKGATMSFDHQATLHWHLRDAAAGAGWPKLRLCVHSGGKSLHGWYGPLNEGGEGAARQLMEYAVTLGADPATWTRCQLVRLPGGLRGKRDTVQSNVLPEGWEMGEEVRQEVIYYDPT